MRIRNTLIGVFLLAILVRLPDVWRPVDGTVRDSWREADVAGIARNFYREGMNLLYPRIDWRGDGPGFTESEFPLYPWFVAVIYHVTGYCEPLLRVTSLLLMLAAFGVFLRIAGRYLTPGGTITAAAVYALMPMDIRMASTIHPEPLMYFAYLAAIDAFDVWLRTESRPSYWTALAATSLAILAKLPAAHLGVLFAFLTLDRWGIAALRRLDVWLFAILSLIPPLAWYFHAHQFWLEYGNSLGISNESLARIGALGFLRHAGQMVPTLVRLELQYVWMPTGALLGLYGLWNCRNDRNSRILLYWAATLGVYYFITCRTTGELWAVHYHVVSIPLAALSIALGCETLSSRLVAPSWRALSFVTFGSGILLLLLAVAAESLHLGPQARVHWVPVFLGLAGCAGANTGVLMQTLTAAGVIREGGPNDLAGPWTATFAPVALLALLSATWVSELFVDFRLLHPCEFVGKYQAALQFREQMSPDTLIVASGGPSTDSYGMPHAYNAPYFFFWTDHKGFTIADEEQSIERLEELRGRGARYFIGERESLVAKPGFLETLRTRYGILVERDEAVLVELTAAAALPANDN